ncbi:MAG: hypothetical protein ACI9PN_002502, partial [Candidatus Azotimanducaceae bacterium]
MIKKMLTKALGKLLVLKVVAIFLLTLSAVHARAYQQIVINEYGPPNVMQLVEQAILPEPGAGEVRIKVLAAGVSFTDTMVRKGVYVGV